MSQISDFRSLRRNGKPKQLMKFLNFGMDTHLQKLINLFGITEQYLGFEWKIYALMVGFYMMQSNI